MSIVGRPFTLELTKLSIPNTKNLSPSISVPQSIYWDLLSHQLWRPAVHIQTNNMYTETQNKADALFVLHQGRLLSLSCTNNSAPETEIGWQYNLTKEMYQLHCNLTKSDTEAPKP